jgi:cell division protein FtsZ
MEKIMTKEKDNDIVTVVPSTKLLKIVEDRIYKKKDKNEFELVDNKVTNEIVNMFTIKKKQDVNIDFNDLKLILSHKKFTFVGISKCKGKNAAHNALEEAIHSYLFDDLPIKNAKGILINFSMLDDYLLYEIEKSMDIIYEIIDSDADIIFGTRTFEKMEDDEVKIVIIAAGLEKVKTM